VVAFRHFKQIEALRKLLIDSWTLLKVWHWLCARSFLLSAHQENGPLGAPDIRISSVIHFLHDRSVLDCAESFSGLHHQRSCGICHLQGIHVDIRLFLFVWILINWQTNMLVVKVYAL